MDIRESPPTTDATTQPVEASRSQPAVPLLLEVGTDFCRKLRRRGHPGRQESADKVFRDSLYDDG